jgi:hypothetical protein
MNPDVKRAKPFCLQIPGLWPAGETCVIGEVLRRAEQPTRANTTAAPTFQHALDTVCIELSDAICSTLT